MLAKITLYDGTIYRIADKTTDTEDGIYLGRIKDELSLVSAMQEAGNAPATINLTIINDNDFIPHSKDLWAAEVLLTNDNGVSWRGKINFCNFDSDGNLYVTASEKTAPELELQLPDEVRQVYTVDEDFHQSSVTMTIPLVIGGTTSNPILLPTILIDKTEGVYLICVGEIRSVVKVYNGTEELPNTAYTAYTGTSSQAEHAGFAYVKINEDYRLNADGSYAEINVEVVGLKLGNFTEEECRNGALFLYYFLTTAATGINGWGCGIDQSEIDTASFQSAITLCNQLGYKLDGIMWLRQSAQSWIDQICQAIHGKYSINANGKRSLFIDYAGNASKKTFTASNMQVDKYGKNSYTSVVYNKGILSYDYNPITGLFMQSAQYENAESIAQIGEQKFVGESYLLKDPTTALAVLEYTCKRSQTAAEAIEFKTDDIDTVLKAGDVITINRPDLSINNALYQIQNISITDYEASISAVKFDTSVFIVSGTPSSVNWGNERDITPALTPAQATNLLLSTGFDINPDGTGTPYISGTFTVPDGGWFAAAVQYGIGTNPSNWTELALITEGRFKISPVNVGTVYSVRVRMITATGHSDYIRGQITATGDTTPPLAPTIDANATDKTVTVQCGLDNPPYDMGGFQIYRKKSTDSESAYTYIGSIAANRGYAAFSDYVDEYVTYNYKAKSYDRSGNLSTQFSDVANVAITGVEAANLAASAIAMPTGSILRLSAKNCTTASIAEDKGVKDCSGYGYHGRAYGGASVIQDSEMGDCFSFDGSDDYLDINSSNLKTYLGTLDSITITITLKETQVSRTKARTYFGIGYNGSSPYAVVGLLSNGKPFIGGKATNALTYRNTYADSAILADKVYQLTGVFDYKEGKAYLYLNGEKVKELTLNGTNQILEAPRFILVGTYNFEWVYGLARDARIYPRALSATEIKTIFMFPDDVTFGQMTADLIGANIIKASNLVTSENLITTTAQIKDAIITDAKISGKIQANHIQTNDIVIGDLSGYNSMITSVNNTAQGYVDALDVGGRNLLRNNFVAGGNTTVNNTNHTVTIGTSNVDTYFYVKLATDVEQGKTYTISCDVSGLQSGKSVVFMVGASNNASLKLSITTNGRCVGTGTMPKARVAGNNLVFDDLTRNFGTTSIVLKNIKLEEGNKATTWTPAPEDVDADATSKANTAKAEAIADSKSYADTELAKKMSIAAYCAANDTTKIDGGTIYTNSLLASSINVSSWRPQGCMIWLSAKGVYSSTMVAGGRIPDISGFGRNFVLTGSNWDRLGNLNGWKFYSKSNNGNVMSIADSKTLAFSAGYFSLFLNLYLQDSDFSKTPIIFDFRNSASNANRIMAYLGSNGELRVQSYNSEGTVTACNTGLILSRAKWYDIAVVVNSTTKLTAYLGERNQPMTASNQFTIGTRGDLSANQITFFNNYSNSANRSFYGYMGNIQVWGGVRLTATQIATLHLMGDDPDMGGGMINADRIQTDAIKSRNYAYSSGLYSTAGTFLDLANGQIISKNFSIDSSGNASFKGAVEASSGKIGSFALNSNGTLKGNMTDGSVVALELETTGNNSSYSRFMSGGLAMQGSGYSCSISSFGFDFTTASDATETYSIPGYLKLKRVLSGGGSNLVELNKTSSAPTTYSNAAVVITPSATSNFGLYVAGKARINTTDYGSDEKTKKDFQDVSTLDKLKALRVCAWRFDEEKLVEKDNAFIDEENIKIEAENKAIDEENKAIEAENELRKNRKDGEPVELLPLKEHKKLKEHRIADKNTNHPLNIGCMAGEFNKAFGTNDGSEDCLSVTDTIGVCMRAIQELAAEVDDLKAKLKIQQDEKSEIIEHFNDLVKEPTDEDELVEPSFDELLKDDETQQGEQK